MIARYFTLRNAKSRRAQWKWRASSTSPGIRNIHPGMTGSARPTSPITTKPNPATTSKCARIKGSSSLAVLTLHKHIIGFGRLAISAAAATRLLELPVDQ